MALAQVSASLSVSIRDTCCFVSPRTNSIRRVSTPNIKLLGTTFASGSPLLKCRNSHPRKAACKAASVSIRCEQSTKDGNGLDIWLGRLAMVGFAAALAVEVSTGKGLLENFGLTSPLPTVALGVTGLVGVLTAVFIFQSSSKN